MALQHLRSSTADKRATPAAMADGQLAMNTNLASPGLFFKDTNGDLVKIGPVHIGTTAPNATPASGGQAGNSKGEQWLDTSGTNPVFKIWDGSNWISEAGEFVNASGDTMTGALVMDNQQQVRFREASGNGTNFIALQAPASVASDKTITLPDVTGTVVTTGDTGSVTSTMILDGTILNADVNASAAIAGTKVAPDFGSQNVVTTGTATAASLNPTGSSVPTNGVYLPAANSVAISTNGTGRLFVDANGNVGAGNSSPGSYNASADDLVVGSSGDTGISIVSGTSSQGSIFFADGTTGGAQQAAGYIIYPHSGDYMAFGTTNTERMRLTSAGLLGLGTSSPGFKLTIEDSTTPRIRIGDGVRHVNLDGGSATQNAAVGTDYSGAFGIYTNGAANTRLHITSAGLVGIGTTSPGFLITAATSADGVDGVSVESPSVNGIIRLRADGTNGNAIRVGGVGAQGNTLRFLAGSDAERMRIDSSGRLLVGTSTALSTGVNNNGSSNVATEQQLQVASASWDKASASFTTYQGNVAGVFAQIGFNRSKSDALGTVGSALASGDALGGITFSGSDGGKFVPGAWITAVADGTFSNNDAPGRLVFSTTLDGASSPTERMRIGNNGITRIFDSSGSGLRVGSASAAGTTDSIFSGSHSATSTTAEGTQSIAIRTNGNIVNTNNSYGSISDVKLKENIVDANSQWDDLKALQVRNYNFKEGQTHTQIGLVAQEAELVSPGLVSESPDRDAEGNDLGTVTKSVNYSVLYMKAVKALQEAMERIEQLESSNADLLARVTALEVS